MAVWPTAGQGAMRPQEVNNVAQGTGARDPITGQPRSNTREFDLTVDYRVTQKGWLEGLWLRLRGAVLEEGGNTQTEIRLILNYAFPVL